jgi:transcriptional/translational regulatory protein YebC/TACO1
LFEKHGGSLGTSGCVNWMFTKKGLITVNAASIEEDQLMEIVLGAGADDMKAVGEVFEITCEPSAYEELKKTLQEKEIQIEVAEISMVPQSTINISDEHTAKRIISLMEAFEDHDDIQNTYANFNIPEEIITHIS